MYERFIARQPIFDRNLNVFGYELLFRSGPENLCTPTQHATANVIVDSSMVLRMDALIGNGKAFLNMNHDDLRSGSAFLLSNSHTVLEITAQPEPNIETILACQNLQNAGFQLALDGFQDDATWKPLVRFASFLKVDFRSTSPEQRKNIVNKYSASELKVVGSRIETREEFAHARKSGYAFFQGFFFLRPEVVVARDLPASKLNCLRLLRESSAPQLRYAEIERLLKQEPGLLYKLLRYLNSPALGLSREVTSVPYALALLGEREFRRWVNVVAVVAAAMDEPVEVLRCAIARAYFCESLSQLLGVAQNSSEFFLMGLLSVMDVLLARPLPQILEELPVSRQVRTALLGGSNALRDVYEAVLAYESADWEGFRAAAARAHINQALVPEKYEAAVRQASSLHDWGD